MRVMYTIPEPGTQNCLVLSVCDFSSRENPVRDYGVARGLDEVSGFLGIPERSWDSVYGRIESLSREEIQEYLDGARREGIQAYLMLCDIGCGGGVKEVHAQSQTYDF